MLNANDVLGALRVYQELKIRSNSASGNLHGDPGHLSGRSREGELTLPWGLEENSPKGALARTWSLQTGEDVSAGVTEILSEE